MKKHYDFSKAKPNPYAKLLNKEVTVKLDGRTVEYFEALSKETGIFFRTLINLYCANVPPIEKSHPSSGNPRPKRRRALERYS